MAPENVLDKIQKLLELQHGAEAIGSLEEANNAAEKVQRLLTKYNLEMSDVHLHTEKNGFDIKRFDFKEVRKKKNEGRWIFALYHTLAKHNYCKIILVGDLGLKANLGGSVKVEQFQYVSMIGAKVNVEIVKKLANRLEERIRAFEKQSWNEYGKYNHKNRNAYRRAFFLGACSGLNTQLMDARAEEMRENANVNALVVQNSQELEDAVGRCFGRVGSARNSRQLQNKDAHYKGYVTGKNMATGEELK